jgi:TATA-box binding protein (TBP) (component of TFIID and TFIIIB)
MNILAVPGSICIPGVEPVASIPAVPDDYDDIENQSQSQSSSYRDTESHDMTFYNNKMIQATMTDTGRALMNANTSARNTVVTEFDMRSSIPLYDSWSSLHYHKPRARAHVEKHVREYLKNLAVARQAALLGLNSEVIAEMAKLNEKRMLVGCTVNVSALGISPLGRFNMNDIIYKQSNGCFTANRNRNSAARVCIRAPTPVPQMPDEVKEYMNMQTTHHVPRRAAERKDPPASQQQSRKRGRNSTKTSNTTTRPRSTAKKSNDEAKDTGVGLFGCTTKPRDQTFLVYPSGAFVLTGAQDSYTALYSMNLLTWMLCCEGMRIDHMEKFSPQNIVSTFRLPFEINLKALEKDMGDELEFLKKRFPAAIFHPDMSNIEMAEKRAAKLRDLRHKIVSDYSWMNEREEKLKSDVARSVGSFSRDQVVKRYDDQMMDRLDDNIDVDDLVDDMEDIFKKDKHSGKRKDKELAVIIHSTGALVITGVSDPFLEMAFYEIMYERLSRFTAESIVKERNRGRRRATRRRVAESKETGQKLVLANQQTQLMRIDQQKKRANKVAKIARDQAAIQTIVNSASTKTNSVLRRDATVALGKDNPDEAAPMIENPFNYASPGTTISRAKAITMASSERADNSDTNMSTALVSVSETADMPDTSIESMLDSITSGANDDQLR